VNASDAVVRSLGDDPAVPTVSVDDRYVVIYALSFDHDDQPSKSGEEVHCARDAAHFALELTRDAGSADGIWRVFDRLTEQWSSFSQGEIEEA
jgi:hypothetical protein